MKYLNRLFLQRKYANGRKAHEEMLGIIRYQGDAIQSQEVQPHNH